MFDGAPRTKMHVDATFGGMLGEAKKDGMLHFLKGAGWADVF